ncbi:MAG: putative PEP-binding protein [Thainema sp.]
MTHLYRLDQIQPSDHYSVGDKAFYLADLQHRGYAVVPGYVVPAPVFQSFLKSIQWLEPLFADLPNSTLHLDVNDAQQLKSIAQQIRQAILNTPLPGVAIECLQQIVEEISSSAAILRPSLTLRTGIDPQLGGRIRGLLETQCCRTTVAELTNHLRRLWAELFRAKSLVYWQRSQISLEQINVAVLVQPLADVAIAGNLRLSTDMTYTAYIEAVQGQGIALTRGEATPEQWWITLQPGQIDRHLPGQQFLEYRLRATARENNSDVEEPDADSFDQLGLATQTRATPYQVEIVDDPTLINLFSSTETLHQLIEIAHSAGIALGTTLDLEWIYGTLEPPNHQSHHPAAQLLITQVNPKTHRYDPDFLLPQVVRWRDRTLPHGTDRTSELAAADLPANPMLSARQPTRINRADVPESVLAALEAADHANQAQRDLLVISGLAASTGRASGTAQVITDPYAEPRALSAGTILVTTEVTPAWLPWLKQVVGIVSEQGGMTCHGAIIARELGIPAVVGAAGVTQQIRDRDRIYIDGDLGHVYSEQHRESHLDFEQPPSQTDQTAHQPNMPRPAASPQPEQSSHLLTSLQPSLEAWKQIPATPKLEFQRIPTATELWVNASQLQSVPKLRSLPLDGVGLLRSELMLLEAFEGEHPSAWLSRHSATAFVERLTEHILPFAQAMSPRPVFYRSLDWRSYEMGQTQPSVMGKNPVLGIRGTFSYQLDSTLFDLELAAIAQVQKSGYDNLRLILPFVRSVQEVQFCQKRIAQAGIDTPNFQLWMMAEVPSVLFLLPSYIQAGIQGISIGTNDLTQLLLGADRDHAQLAAAYDERHPAVVAAIEQLVKTARQHGIPCSICGQAPVRDPKLIKSLIRWGITSISVELDAVEPTYWEIVRSEKRLLLEQLE